MRVILLFAQVILSHGRQLVSAKLRINSKQDAYWVFASQRQLM